MVQIGAVLLACVISGFFCRFLEVGGFLEFVLKGITCAIVTNSLFLLLFFRTNEFQFVKDEVETILNKILRK